MNTMHKYNGNSFAKFKKYALKLIPVLYGKTSGYINCKETVSAANARQMSVCDYVEVIWDQKGQTQQIIDEMRQIGCFEDASTICEIGPGTGRYIEKILGIKANIDKYVIYETAEDWSRWLEKKYNLTRRDADGYSLKYEQNKTQDLIHAHGVFVYLNFVHCFKYFKEMIRVVKPGGFIVFDFYPVNYFDIPTIEKWISSAHSYPVVLPENTIKEFFELNGLKLIHAFSSKHGQGYSQYHVYKKN